MPDPNTILTDLMRMIESRRDERPAESYTTTLFDGGIARIAAKLREEIEELIQAAGESPADTAHLTHEAADVLYHILVLLASEKVSLGAVTDELARRSGVSGLEEKRRRTAT